MPGPWHPCWRHHQDQHPPGPGPCHSPQPPSPPLPPPLLPQYLVFARIRRTRPRTNTRARSACPRAQGAHETRWQVQGSAGPHTAGVASPLERRPLIRRARSTRVPCACTPALELSTQVGASFPNALRPPR